MASKKPKRAVTLADVGRQLPGGDEFEEYLNRIEEIDGRAAALSQSAFLEAQLERAIALNLQLHDAKHYEDVFSRAGAPLTSFSAKITLAAALGILNPEQRKTCDRIRIVRNAFAHSIKTIDFDTSQVAEECRKLDPQSLLPSDVTWQAETASARERFRTSGILVSDHLIKYMRAAVEARKAAGMWRDP